MTSRCPECGLWFNDCELAEDNKRGVVTCPGQHRWRFKSWKNRPWGTTVYELTEQVGSPATDQEET